MKKIYCKDCEYYYCRQIYDASDVEICKCPDNTIFYDTYLTRMVEYKKTPMILNKRNNCEWFSEINEGDKNV